MVRVPDDIAHCGSDPARAGHPCVRFAYLIWLGMGQCAGRSMNVIGGHSPAFVAPTISNPCRW